MASLNETSHFPSTRADRGVARWGWPLATVLVTVLLALVRLAVQTRFYYTDDTERGSAGLWWELGEKLLQGQLPMLDPSAWQAGNYWAEGQWGLLNPITWLIALGTHATDSPVLHATIVKIAFLALLSLGVYLLSRDFGAARPWAAFAGIVVPTSGFVVYMDAASWSTDLFNVALLPLVWWALRRSVEHGRSPIPYLVASYVLITFGYVFGVLVLVVVLVESLVRHIVRRDRARIRRSLVASVWGALLTVAVFLPGLLTAGVTDRGSAPIENLGFLNADLTDLASSGNPWVSATIRAWDGDVTEGPLVYLGWFVLLLPFALPIARAQVRRLIPILVTGGLVLLFVLGPSHLGPLRWPLRLIPYLAIAAAVVFAVGISHRYPAAVRARTAWLSLIVIAVTSVLTWGNGPYAWKAIAASAAVSVAVVLCLSWIARSPRVRRRTTWAALVSIAMTALCVAGQLYLLPRSPLDGRASPDSFAQLQDVLPEAHGDAIVVGDPNDDWQDAASWDERLIANLWYLSPTHVSSLYTVLPFTAFTDDLCVDLRGKTCADALDVLWSDDPETGVAVADLMSVSTIVAMKGEYPDEPVAPSGWHLAADGEYTWLFERDEAAPAAGGVVWSGDGTEVTVEAQSDTDVTFTVDAVGSDGRVVLSRLPYPGYRVDGATLDDPVRGWLLTVDVSGASVGDTVTISFRPPGWTGEIGAFVLALGVGTAWAIAAFVAGRRRGRPAQSPSR